MEYDLFLKYKTELSLNINDKYIGALHDHIFSDIMYEPEEAVADEEDDDDNGTKIGFFSWLQYNQVLAIAYGVNMTQIPFLKFLINSKALMELDHTRISKET